MKPPASPARSPASPTPAARWRSSAPFAPFFAWPWAAVEYGVDAWQRSILLQDILRQRGNESTEHEREGMPPVLVFDHETLADARTLPEPVNYALLRIIPPADMPTDPAKRPFVVIDPRAGTAPASGASRPTARSASHCAPGTRATSSRSSAIRVRARRSSPSRGPRQASCRSSPNATLTHRASVLNVEVTELSLMKILCFNNHRVGSMFYNPRPDRPQSSGNLSPAIMLYNPPHPVGSRRNASLGILQNLSPQPVSAAGHLVEMYPFPDY